MIAQMPIGNHQDAYNRMYVQGRGGVYRIQLNHATHLERASVDCRSWIYEYHYNELVRIWKP